MLWGASWWDALSALGTVGAVVVALLLAATERRRARRAEKSLASERQLHAARDTERAAAMVSAWIEVAPRPSEGGRHYDRLAVVHVSNQSDQPVYNANVCVGIQNEPGRWTPVGPLAVPLPLPVLAPRSQQIWDITLPLMACSMDLGNFVSNPSAAIAFSDPSGQRWMRNFDLAIARQERNGDAGLFSIDPDHGDEQLGQIDNPFNPVGVVALFLSAWSSDDGPDLSLARSLLDPTAQGWSAMSDEDFAKAGQQWANLGIAAHVHYPAPRIAYVKTLLEDAAQRQVAEPGYVEVAMTFFTLRFIRNLGWRIFSVGWATRADMIEFPEADLLTDIRIAGGRDASPKDQLEKSDGH